MCADSTLIFIVGEQPNWRPLKSNTQEDNLIFKLRHDVKQAKTMHFYALYHILSQ